MEAQQIVLSKLRCEDSHSGAVVPGYGRQTAVHKWAVKYWELQHTHKDLVIFIVNPLTEANVIMANLSKTASKQSSGLRGVEASSSGELQN